MAKVIVAKFSELEDKKPAYALVANVDLVVIRYDNKVSVLYGRCAHRGALMSDATIQGDNIICGVHGWDYQFETGVSAYNNAERLPKFSAWIDNDEVLVDQDEIAAWEKKILRPIIAMHIKGFTKICTVDPRNLITSLFNN